MSRALAGANVAGARRGRGGGAQVGHPVDRISQLL